MVSFRSATCSVSSVICRPLSIVAGAGAGCCFFLSSLCSERVCQAEPTVTPAECPVSSVGGYQVIQITEELCVSESSPHSTAFAAACQEAGGILQTEGVGPSTMNCLFRLPPGETICETGTLNEASGLCEVKPGNRGSNRA
jgi:hypothetical protein